MMALRRRLTYRVELPGGQLRLREMVIHVSERCAGATRFGKIKLNKIIWKADFDAYAARRVPVTGRAYLRQKFGPVPAEMPPLYSEMLQDDLITVKFVDLGDSYIEHRTIPKVKPELRKFFSDDDMARRRSITIGTLLAKNPAMTHMALLGARAQMAILCHTN